MKIDRVNAQTTLKRNDAVATWKDAILGTDFKYETKNDFCGRTPAPGQVKKSHSTADSIHKKLSATYTPVLIHILWLEKVPGKHTPTSSRPST